MTESSIEWTDETWNPTVGCSKVSEGCRHCYAMVMASRIANAAIAMLREGRKLTPKQLAYMQVVRWERGGMGRADDNDKAMPEWNGRVVFVEEALLEPLSWQKPRRVFVNSMSDIFHPTVGIDELAEIFAVMAASPEHTFQVLTKRPERMAEILGSETFPGRVRAAVGNLADRFPKQVAKDAAAFQWPIRNVWLGTSVEDQEAADGRIPHLLYTPAAIRFLSCEPLLGGVDLSGLFDNDHEHPEGGPVCGACFAGTGPGTIDWVICGGESGNGARPMELEWARSLRDQCEGEGVAFFFKQVGACAATESLKGGSEADIPADLFVREFPTGAKA